jgi:hypothetical protein
VRADKESGNGTRRGPARGRCTEGKKSARGRGGDTPNEEWIMTDQPPEDHQSDQARGLSDEKSTCSPPPPRQIFLFYIILAPGLAAYRRNVTFRAPRFAR